MRERSTMRSIKRYLQEERADRDPEYEERLIKRDIRRFLLINAAGTTVFATLLLATLLPLAESQEQYREQYCPTHHQTIECVETPTVPMVTPIQLPDNYPPASSAISRRQ